MDWNVAEGNFLGGNFPEENSTRRNLMGGNFPNGSSPGEIFLEP